MLAPPPHTVILYADLASPNFREMHTFLFAAASKAAPAVEYILRPIPRHARDTSQRNYLTGYGVSLDLKKTDYLAVDDRNGGRGIQTL